MEPSEVYSFNSIPFSIYTGIIISRISTDLALPIELTATKILALVLKPVL